MDALSRRIALAVFAIVTACSLSHDKFIPLEAPEDCAVHGDEDRNGLADCEDPACAGVPACQSAAPPVCGNGSVEGDEKCDDGNDSNGDACENDCTAPRCGNGIPDQGEACDDGNTNNDDDCHNNCSAPRCGNGTVEGTEQCDDGNSVDGDACETDCTTPHCGNHIIDEHEQCDDGNLLSGDACEADCTTPRCGNGIIDPNEECDGAPVRGLACEADCTLARCGNTIVDAGEQCDDGNAIDGDTCDSNCKFPPPRNYRCGYAMMGNNCDNFRTSNALVSANMTTAVAGCRAAKTATADLCYVLDDSGATIPDVSNCTAAGGSWRAGNSCCNFFGTLSCP